MSNPASRATIQLDSQSRTVSLKGRAVRLTRMQYRLLECLLREPQRVFQRQELLSAIADGAVVLDRTIDVHIAALRRRIGKWELIETVRNAGYRLGRVEKS
jgi:two-component system phosphate regulon response regulator PhoB